MKAGNSERDPHLIGHSGATNYRLPSRIKEKVGGKKVVLLILIATALLASSLIIAKLFTGQVDN